MAETDSEGRTRFTRMRVLRDPNGPILHQDKGPVGLRAPNGFIWGHTLGEFFYIARVPSMDSYVTTWSRSMLKEFGENYDEIEAVTWKLPLDPPRVRRPWPVLILPPDHPAQPDPPLGTIDTGCEWEHSDLMCYTVRVDDSGCYDDVKQAYTPSRLLPRPCPADASKSCTGRLMFNHGTEAVLDAHGNPYHLVWCPHFRAKFNDRASLPDQDQVISHAAERICSERAERVLIDIDGLCLVDRPQSPRDGNPSAAPISDASGETIPAPNVPATLLEEATVEDNVSDNHVIQHDSNEVPDASNMDQGPSAGVQASVSQDQHQENMAQQDDATTANRFSVKDLPKLEEFIPDGLLPDVLLVHDPDRTTGHDQAIDQPVTYKRVVYKRPRDTRPTLVHTDKPRIGHLHLRSDNRLGEGHHSHVYRVPLTLPEPLSAHSHTGQVTVAAKLAIGECTAHFLLHNEARVYEQFPQQAQQEYCGFNIVPPCRFPVPVGPIVPKYYGFYLPFDEDGDTWDITAEEAREVHQECTEDEPCELDWPSPILLMEECGEPVQPEKFTIDQRTECFSLVLRLHALNITQRSFYVRNIMIQPGPLSAPPAKRTYEHPSFRIIDFGRGHSLKQVLAVVRKRGKTTRAKVESNFRLEMHHEERKAREELLIEPCEF
ncbi:hypothetical protein C2E23DRAFT_469180 [Lenzites betulinus]|nr:hypothetical protein C2E23DRAFT_469180 [Lenzites betulinus]